MIRRLLQPSVICLLLGTQIPVAGAQNMSTNQVLREGNFLYEVKIIDEFIERFNDAPNSNLRRQYRKHNKPVNFTRRDLLNALFEPPSIVQNQFVRTFVNQVLDTAHPQYIAFGDTAWYADLEGHFIMNGRKLMIPLILQVVTGPSHGSKWVICGIGESEVLNGDTLIESSTLASSAKTGVIPPSNDALGFMELENALKTGMNPSGYFTPQVLSTPRAQKFVSLVQSGKLVFEGSGTLKYHFFQIPGYVFTVERFVRNTNHSGWLISNLSSATDEEKLAQKAALLQHSL